MSGRLLQNRGAIIPTLSASGLATDAVRRAWAASAYGAWDGTQLLANFQGLVRHEGHWQRHRVGGLRPVAVDHVGFFRPRLKNCPTQHYDSQASKALPAVRFGVLTAVGSVGQQAVPVLRDLVRAPDNQALLTAAQAPDEYLVADRGSCLAQMQAAQVERFLLRVAKNFTARRASLPTYAGRRRTPTRGVLVRPCARAYRGRTLAATPPDRTEAGQHEGRAMQAQVWDQLVSSTAAPGAPTFICYLISDPNYHTPLLLVSSLKLSAAEAYAAYRERWPVEQLPQTAKQLLGAHRQFVFGEDARQRLPEVALLCSSLLTCTCGVGRCVLGRHPASRTHRVLGSSPTTDGRTLAPPAGPTLIFRRLADSGTHSQKELRHRPPTQRYYWPLSYAGPCTRFISINLACPAGRFSGN